MRLIFIRHPETHANVRKLIYGRTESDYSEKGKNSIRWVVEHLRERTISGIYASPLKRTAMLADSIGTEYGVPVRFRDELMEMDFGVFENLTPEEAAEKYDQYYKAFMDNYTDYMIPDGESFRGVYDRVAGFMQEIIAADGTCVIVTHGMVIKAALAYLLDLGLDDVWHFNTQPAAIIEIEYRDRYGVLHGLTGPDMG